MIGGRLLFIAYMSVLSLPLVHLTAGATTDNNNCAPSSCGNIQNISYPFRLRGDPNNCGNKRYELVCEQNLTALYLYSGKYYVQAISYNNYTIQMVDAGIQKDNCSSLPRYSLISSNFSEKDAFTWYKYEWGTSEFMPSLTESIVFLNCPNPVNSSSSYVDAASCWNADFPSNSSFSGSRSYYYVVSGPVVAAEVEDMCRVELMTMTSLFPVERGKNISYAEIYSRLLYGFELSFFRFRCGKCRDYESCYVDSADHLLCYGDYGFYLGILSYLRLILLIIGCIIAFKFVCGAPCVFLFLIYKWRKRHMSMYDRIENFLQSHNNLMPIRYSYSQIKKMTDGFKDKLGEGGYSSVFKGKLRSGHFVAVKMLGKSKANGQEFINEVATIGRIHHVNVVHLIGFCTEGSKRALVYEFMPNWLP